MIVSHHTELTNENLLLLFTLKSLHTLPLTGWEVPVPECAEGGTRCRLDFTHDVYVIDMKCECRPRKGWRIITTCLSLWLDLFLVSSHSQSLLVGCGARHLEAAPAVTA